MRGWKEDYAYVFHEDEYKGVVTKEAVEEACEKSSGPVPHLHEIADEGPTLQPGTILQNALPATLNSDYPVPVVSEDGAYHGTLSKRDMVEILTNSNASIQVA